MAALERIGPRKPPRRADQHDMEIVTRFVVETLEERALAGFRIGVELEDIPAREFLRSQHALPRAPFVDSTQIFRALRLIKAPEEIQHLRTAARVAKQAMIAVVASVEERLMDVH